MTESSKSDQAKRAPSKHWKVYLAIICAGIVMCILGFGVTYTNTAYYIGYFLLPSLVVAAIARGVFGRGAGKGVTLSIFGAVWVSFILGAFISNRLAQQQRDETVEHILDQAEELFEEQWATNPDGTLRPIDRRFEPDPNATGLYAEAQKFMSGLLNRSVSLRNQYLTELEEIGWTTILEPSRLEADRTLEESRMLLEIGKTTGAKYAAIGRELLENSPDEIQYLNLSDREKRDFETGYREGLAKSIALYEQIWSLEAATYDEFEKIINFLAANPGSLWFENDQFVFESQEQADEFNQFWANIDELAAKQQRLQQSNLEAQRRQMDYQ